MIIKKLVPYAAITALGLVVAAFLVYKHQGDVAQIKQAYVAEKTAEVSSVGTKVEESFRAFYQGLRTISQLPGVRTIDRYGKTFQPDSREAMQQIYNNIYLNVTLSEVYILPATLDADKIDPNTGEPEAPILTFDEFIVGGASKDAAEGEGEELEEVEIHEYRLMKKQLEYLKSRYPTNRSFRGLEVPGVTGEPVVTCDNSEFRAKDLKDGNDRPRLGLVYTLPLYDAAGNFNGAVSGIVRTAVLERLLPKGSFALVNTTHSYVGVVEPSSVFTQARKSFEQGQTDTSIVFNQIKRLDVVDSSAWDLWVALPNEAFENLQQVKQANVILYAGLAFALLIVVGLSLGVYSSQRDQATLEARVLDKTRELGARNESMRLILDNAEEAFLTCSLTGEIGPEFSRISAEWFGEPAAGTPIWKYLIKDDPKQQMMFEMGWGQLVEEMLPFEVSAAQMPGTIHRDGASYGLSFTPIRGEGDVLKSVLVVAVNVTARLQAERTNQEQREVLSAFQALSRDRVGFLEYFADAEAIVKSFVDGSVGSSKDVQFRVIHTLKGNSSLFGLVSITEVAHELESKLHDGEDTLNPEDVARLRESWEGISGRLLTLMGDRNTKRIELEEKEYFDVLKRIKTGASLPDIVSSIERWRLEPASARLNRMKEQAESLGKRLDIAGLQVTTDDHGVRLEPDSLLDFWSAMVHVVRNAVDHGFADAKVAAPRIALETDTPVPGFLRLRVRDNGKGVDWDRVRSKAERVGLPCTTRAELEDCLFADGLSTKDSVSTVSGRGVGMAAVKQVVLELGGSISVRSEKGEGTEFSFQVPLPKPVRMSIRPALASLPPRAQ